MIDLAFSGLPSLNATTAVSIMAIMQSALGIAVAIVAIVAVGLVLIIRGKKSKRLLEP